MLQVTDGCKTYNLEEGRMAMIVRWLLQAGVQVVMPEKVQVTFDCAGSNVSVEVRQREQLQRK